jgi:hypothetical protein
MNILLYIFVGIFYIMGLSLGMAAEKFKFRHIGLILGSLTYTLSATTALYLDRWWPLLAGFIIAWGIRALGGDPSL